MKQQAIITLTDIGETLNFAIDYKPELDLNAPVSSQAVAASMAIFKLIGGKEPTPPAWISVGDEMPDADITVLIANNGPATDWSDPVWLGYFDGDVWCTPDGVALDSRKGDKPYNPPPTHWMPLPELPATEEANG